MIRSEDEWRELYARLKAIADDKEEEYRRRQRALAIIEDIPREFRGPKPSLSDDYPEEYPGQIV